MSKLADKIRRAGKVEAGPIGFGVVAERRPSPTLLCLLRLDKDQAKKVGDTADAAADAVIITGLEAGKLGDALQKLGDVPVGLRAEDAQRATVAAAREAGADFVLLDEESSAEVVLEEKVGLVLRLGAQAGDTELRALSGLALDALEIAPIGEPFTVRRLMELRRLSLLSQTPLLVEVTPEIGPYRLEALRGAGVAGVILDGKSADKLSALRQVILSLPARGQRREERVDALLPSHTAVPAVEEEEPEFE
ncbi:MAG: hypothetical protein IH864_03330 [Chloroflexi bacterium]|nr:hypothetical protein [Chloroflexota bacterium]